MRGLACVLMFQTHCYDAWLGGDARNTRFLKGSQLRPILLTAGQRGLRSLPPDVTAFIDQLKRDQRI